MSVYPVVDFGQETMLRPETREFAPDDKVVLKHRTSYLAERPTPSGTSWTRNSGDAYVMSYEEAVRYRSQDSWGWLAESTIVVAPKTSTQRVVILIDGTRFVQKRSSRYLYSTHAKSAAKHYSSVGAARSAMKKLQTAFPKHSYELLVEEVES